MLFKLKNKDLLIKKYLERTEESKENREEKIKN